MGKRGPAPKPTNLRLLHGDHPERVNRDEPVPANAVEPIRPPSWLSTAARNTWARYAPDLIRQRVLTAWDVEAFAHWCDAVARRRKAVAEIAKQGEVVESGTRIVRNPWVLVLSQADAQAQRWGARFGLTPSDRSQLNVGESRRGPTDDLLSG